MFDVCPAAEIGKVLNILAVQDKDIFNLAAPVQDAAPAADPVAAEDAPETAANVPAFVSVWACMPEIWQTDAPAVSDRINNNKVTNSPDGHKIFELWKIKI